MVSNEFTYQRLSLMVSAAIKICYFLFNILYCANLLPPISRFNLRLLKFASLIFFRWMLWLSKQEDHHRRLGLGLVSCHRCTVVSFLCSFSLYLDKLPLKCRYEYICRISLEVMTLNPVCENVETSEGVPLTVTGVAQCKVTALSVQLMLRPILLLRCSTPSFSR